VALDPDEVEAIDAQASVLMKRGIALMESGRPEVIPDALTCFDQARDLRSGLPIREVPVLRYGLAACWLNRADALIRLGEAAQIFSALQSYDEGIALLRDLPFADDLRFSRRLAIAHQNRGLALQTQGRAGVAQAVTAFGDAIAVLEHEHSAAIPDRDYLLAVVWVNLANAQAVLATDESCSRARDAAARAIAIVKDVEERDEHAAEVGLMARHVLCHTMAKHLSATSDGTVNDDVHETTDVVDDGLSLARRWEQAGVVRFRAIAHDLFRFGARVYALYQPHFLDEFVRDNLDPARSSAEYVDSNEMRAAAEEARALRTRSGSS
jgi:tetratricopeptide (TPR) repeat protein